MERRQAFRFVHPLDGGGLMWILHETWTCGCLSNQLLCVELFAWRWRRHQIFVVLNYGNLPQSGFFCDRFFAGISFCVY